MGVLFARVVEIQNVNMKLDQLFGNNFPSSFDGLVEYLLKEGLITSFEVNKFKQHLKKMFGDDIIIDNKEKPIFTYKAYVFAVHIYGFDDSKQKKVEQLCDLYGYSVYLKETYSYKYRQITTLSIEPKYPILINQLLQQKQVKKLFHITPKSNIDKIQKIGLTPRKSETTFAHPDDRIYLIYSPRRLHLAGLAQSLATNKNLNFEDIAIFETPYQPQIKYYLDETATSPQRETYACFILNNISPKDLKLWS